MTVNEVVRAVNIALGNTPVSACPAADSDGDGQVSINEIVASVRWVLVGCPTFATPTRSSTPSVTPTATPTGPTPTPTSTMPTATPTNTPTGPTAPPTTTLTATAAPTGGTALPTPTRTATPTPGLATRTATVTLTTAPTNTRTVAPATPSPGSTPAGGDAAIAARLPIIAKAFSVFPIVAAAIADGANFSAPPADGAGLTSGVGTSPCPLGGTATESGTLSGPAPNVLFTLNGCKVETGGGTLTLDGTARLSAQEFLMNPRFDVDVTGHFADAEGHPGFVAEAKFGAPSESLGLGGRCYQRTMTIRADGSLRATTPDGRVSEVGLSGTRILFSPGSPNGYDASCVATMYRIEIDGPATLSTSEGETASVDLDNLVIDVAGVDAATQFTFYNGLNAACLGSRTLITSQPLLLAWNALCPSAGDVTWGAQAPRTHVRYQPGSVQVDVGFDDSVELDLPDCLAPELLACPP